MILLGSEMKGVGFARVVSEELLYSFIRVCNRAELG